MNILALDSSSSLLSVCLRTEGGRAEATLDLGLKHAERLMDLIDFCLTKAGLEASHLDLLACTQGPGSFTGLRIGMATVKGMAFALGKPWLALPTLDCLAHGREVFPGAVVPVLDGKKGRLYTAFYLRGRRMSDWLDIPLARLAALLDTYPEALVTGPDAELLEELAAERSGIRVDPRAREGAAWAAAELALERFPREGASPGEAGPLYLRPSEAEEPLLSQEKKATSRGETER